MGGSSNDISQFPNFNAELNTIKLSIKIIFVWRRKTSKKLATTYLSTQPAVRSTYSSQAEPCRDEAKTAHPRGYKPASMSRTLQTNSRDTFTLSYACPFRPPVPATTTTTVVVLSILLKYLYCLYRTTTAKRETNQQPNPLGDLLRRMILKLQTVHVARASTYTSAVSTGLYRYHNTPLYCTTLVLSVYYDTIILLLILYCCTIVIRECWLYRGRVRSTVQQQFHYHTCISPTFSPRMFRCVRRNRRGCANPR